MVHKKLIKTIPQFLDLKIKENVTEVGQKNVVTAALLVSLPG